MQWFSALLKNLLLHVAPVENGSNFSCPVASIILGLLLYSVAHCNVPVVEG